jgi:hypothetical protein
MLEAPASRAAAAAVSERLSALLPDEPPAAPAGPEPPILEEPAPPEPSPAPETVAVEPEPAEAEAEAAPAAPKPQEAEQAALFPSRQVIWRETPRQAQASKRRDEEAAMPLAAVIVLFVLGAGLFGGGAYLVLNTAAPGPAWALAALGAVCLAVSIYAALRRIGGRDD